MILNLIMSSFTQSEPESELELFTTPNFLAKPLTDDELEQFRKNIENIGSCDEPYREAIMSEKGLTLPEKWSWDEYYPILDLQLSEYNDRTPWYLGRDYKFRNGVNCYEYLKPDIQCIKHLLTIGCNPQEGLNKFIHIIIDSMDNYTNEPYGQKWIIECIKLFYDKGVTYTNYTFLFGLKEDNNDDFMDIGYEYNEDCFENGWFYTDRRPNIIDILVKIFNFDVTQVPFKWEDIIARNVDYIEGDGDILIINEAKKLSRLKYDCPVLNNS